MVQSIPDPFDSYGPPKKEGQLFSILTPLMTPESNANSPWSGTAGVAEFPKTDLSTSEWEGVSARTRRHSSPIATSSSPGSNHTIIPPLTPIPSRHLTMPTILSVIDESRNQDENQAPTPDNDNSTLDPSNSTLTAETLPDSEQQLPSSSSTHTSDTGSTPISNPESKEL